MESMIDLDALECRMRDLQVLKFAMRQSKLHGESPLRSIVEKRIGDREPPMPRWPSGFMSDFDAVIGGFVGVTVIAGDGGTGKSTHAMACALTNVRQPGTAVFYFDAENQLGDQTKRAVAWHGGVEEFNRQMSAVNGIHFHWVEVLPGISYEQLMHYAADRILPEHERVLLIFDSVQSICRAGRGRASRFDVEDRFYDEVVSLAKLPGCPLGVLALSEVNGGGGVSGKRGMYAGSLVMKFEKDDEDEKVVKLEMLKHRSGPLQWKLGSYSIDWGNGELRKLEGER